MTRTPEEVLSNDHAALAALRPGLLEKGHGGEVALVVGGEIIDLFPSEVDAYEAGIERFGLDTTFLVEQVAEEPAAAEPIAWHFGLMLVS